MKNKPLTFPAGAAIGSVALVCAALALGTAHAQDKGADNGTDPTRLSTSAEVRYEHFDLRPRGSNGILRMSYTVPLGEKRDYALRFRVPVTRNSVLGNSDHGLGDASIQLQHVFGVTRAGGYVVQGELIFDTASRPELGTGKHVLKGTFIYALFQPDGGIVAPAIVHSESLGGSSSRPRVRVTTLDFYYVPKLADPTMFMTIDPALTFDWKNKKDFASLAVTVGKGIGPAFGGNAQILVKPTLFAGGDRPAKWGLEVGYRVLGF
jgi:hypothetical protein